MALAEGDLDINVFQQKPYLDTFKKENNLDLVEVFQVPTAPLGIYSGKKTALTDAFDGMKVSAPNDPSNFARALVMMNDLGWITLKDGIDPLTASKADIASNPMLSWKRPSCQELVKKLILRSLTVTMPPTLASN